MADAKISGLAAVTTVGATDETVLAVGGATKKITGANLKIAMTVPHPRKTGRYYTLTESTNDATSVTTLSQSLYTPWPVYAALTIDRISLGVSSAGGALSVVRLGIYISGSDGLPLTLVLDAGTIDGTSATYQDITVSQALTANTLYWASTTWQIGTAGSVRTLGLGSGGQYVPLLNNQGDPRSCALTEAAVIGALPGTATPATTPVTVAPAVKFRVA